MRIVELSAQGKKLDFNAARAMAEQAAAAQEVMPVAWFDGKNNKGHPDAMECTSKPGWLAYAESHGGNIRVNINLATSEVGMGKFSPLRPLDNP